MTLGFDDCCCTSCNKFCTGVYNPPEHIRLNVDGVDLAAQIPLDFDGDDPTCGDVCSDINSTYSLTYQLTGRSTAYLKPLCVWRYYWPESKCSLLPEKNLSYICLEVGLFERGPGDLYIGDIPRDKPCVIASCLGWAVGVQQFAFFAYSWDKKPKCGKWLESPLQLQRFGTWMSYLAGDGWNNATLTLLPASMPAASLPEHRTPTRPSLATIFSPAAADLARKRALECLQCSHVRKETAVSISCLILDGNISCARERIGRHQARLLDPHWKCTLEKDTPDETDPAALLPLPPPTLPL